MKKPILINKDNLTLIRESKIKHPTLKTFLDSLEDFNNVKSKEFALELVGQLVKKDENNQMVYLDNYLIRTKPLWTTSP